MEYYTEDGTVNASNVLTGYTYIPVKKTVIVDYYDSTRLRPRVSTCKNCGAPVHNNICEYCGTEY